MSAHANDLLPERRTLARRLNMLLLAFTVLSLPAVIILIPRFLYFVLLSSSAFLGALLLGRRGHFLIQRLLVLLTMLGGIAFYTVQMGAATHMHYSALSVVPLAFCFFGRGEMPGLIASCLAALALLLGAEWLAVHGALPGLMPTPWHTPLSIALSAFIMTVGSLAFLFRCNRLNEALLQAARDRAEAAREDAQRYSVLKSQFLANMSHEIRTPLNGILGLTALTLEAPLADEQRDNLLAVQSSAQILLVLVNEILDLSKIEAGKMQLEHVPLSLVQVLRHALRPLESQARGKGLELLLEVSSGGEALLLGDPVRLGQVVTNLVGNALKFTLAGHITVRAAWDSGELRVAVQDTGIGIPPDRQAQIFEAFTQADGTTTRRFGGTGLGLKICRDLVELMGGRLGVESQPGVGSVFSFTAQLAAAPVEAQGDRQASRPAPSAAAPTGPGLAVLLAEDNPINARIARKMLERQGHRVTHVETGVGALAETAQGIFDVVLMDMQMPEMDGLEATRRIRAREQGTGTGPLRIVALTANAMTGDRELCLAAGMDDYLTKPLHADKLRQMLEHRS